MTNYTRKVLLEFLEHQQRINWEYLRFLSEMLNSSDARVERMSETIEHQDESLKELQEMLKPIP